MKNLGYLGLGFTACGFVQLLAFLGFAFPSMANGALLVLMGIVLAIVIAGAIHWIFLRMKGYRSNDHLVVGFMPVLVLMPIFILFVLMGVHLAFK